MSITLQRTTPEQRAPLYEDVETLIDFGFVSYTLTVNNVVISMRSLNPGDQFVLRHRVHNADRESWRSHAIAASIWMVDGYNILGEMNASLRMSKFVRNLPNNVRDVLFNAVLSLFERANKAVEAIESYAYEKSSRYKWRTMSVGSFNNHSGVAGAESIGTNYVQRMWTFFNTIEDQRIADDNMWDGFKLSASAQSPKGVKKIDSRDQQNRQTELDRRQVVNDKFYYTVKGVIKNTQVDKKTGPRVGPKTADDLSEEMRRWVAGEDDWHDEIVNEYKRKVSENYDRHKSEAAARAAVLSAARDDENGVPQKMVAYTPDQLARILKDKSPGPAGVRQVGDGVSVVREHLYTKYLDRAPDSGALRVTDDGQMSIIDSGVVGDLDEVISARRVVYKPGQDDQDPDQVEW